MYNQKLNQYSNQFKSVLLKRQKNQLDSSLAKTKLKSLYRKSYLNSDVGKSNLRKEFLRVFRRL